MIKLITLIIISYSFAYGQYSPSSPYILNPERAIGYTDSCAAFWMKTWDNNSGGFFTNIDRTGNLIASWGTNKNMLTQSRNAYGLTRAYMLTGDTAYLNLAGRALEWMYDHAWDTAYGGWYQEIDINGNPMFPTNEKTAFYQHYALLGITAYYEATGDTSAFNQLMRGYDHLEEFFWDTASAYKGYFDRISFNNQNASGKSFNATVDAVTTHLLYLYLMTRENIYKERLQEIAAQIQNRFAASMTSQAIGFVEEYDSFWGWDNSNTMTLMGHVLKAGWCLARINQLFPDTSYVNTAEYLINNVWQKGYDHVYGGPYKDFNRVTGQMLLWGLGDSAKAWWQMEQAITAGLQMYDLTKESWYLEMADETMDFYMNYFVDHIYGDVYADRKRRGGLAWNDAKGSSGKAGYHSIETGYYTYLYGNLFFTAQPVVLHYNIEPLQADRELNMTPLAINDSSLIISQVLLNGVSYTNYNSGLRVLNLPAGTGGHFEVTYSPVMPVQVSDPIITVKDYKLEQNYPNPFNPVTNIKFTIAAESKVTMIIYDALGREVTELVNEQKPPGSYEIKWDASALPSGIYFYQINAGSFTETRKMVLIK
jgi:mannose/cellobiose epimerase-like protein (N-acyl-D-glucosamine 2-epimerase family)